MHFIFVQYNQVIQKYVMNTKFLEIFTISINILNNITYYLLVIYMHNEY